jgi:ParB family chromosome partitioning protein
MNEIKSSWSFVEISPEAREAAERAATAAGMDLDAWLAQLIKYTSAMELKTTSPAASAKAEATPPKPVPAPPARPLTPPPLPPLPTVPPNLAIAPPAAEAAPRANADTLIAGERPGPSAERTAERPVAAKAERGAAPPPFSLPSPAPRPTVLMPQRPGGPVFGLSLRPATAERLAPPPEATPVAAVAPQVLSPPPLAAAVPAAPTPVPAFMLRAAKADLERSAKAEPERAAKAETEPPAQPEAKPDAPPPVVDAPREAAPAPAPAPATAPAEIPRLVATDMLQPSRFAALASPKEDDIQAALDKWRASGMLEPLLVRAKPGAPGHFEIISGIDRWHAARRAYVRQIPVIAREASDQEALEQGLVDQLRRGPITPLAEANIYLRLLNDAGLDTERAARLAGKPVSHVATMVRILNLPKSVRAMLEKGEITVMHARALLDAPNPEAIARDIVEKRLDIYQTEQLVRVAGRDAEMVDPSVLLDAPTDDSIEALGTGPFARETRETRAPAASATPRLQPVESQAEPPRAEELPRPPAPTARRPSEQRAPRETDVISTELLERNIANALGVRCAISERNGVGVISVHYTNREELGRILSRINGGGTSG